MKEEMSRTQQFIFNRGYLYGTIKGCYKQLSEVNELGVTSSLERSELSKVFVSLALIGEFFDEETESLCRGRFPEE